MSWFRFDVRPPARCDYEGVAPRGQTPGKRRRDEEKRRHFEELLNDKAARGEAGTPLPFVVPLRESALDDDAETRAIDTGERGLSRAHHAVTASGMPLPAAAAPAATQPLYLRLTNGVLAGMEIHAAMQAGAMSLRVVLADRRRLERFAEQREKLVLILETLFECPVDLEITHEVAQAR